MSSHLSMEVLLLILLLTKSQISSSSTSKINFSLKHLSSYGGNTNEHRERNNIRMILYNKIPSSGSTSFMTVLYNLQAADRINLTHIDVSSKIRRFTYIDQYEFSLNIFYWSREGKSAIFHGHFPFIDVTRFGISQPLYINIIRNPLERLVSHYYSLHYDDAYFPGELETRVENKRTFDECVTQKGKECDPKKLWLQIPYFCGTDAECWDVGNKKALEKAKTNVLDHYFLVGVIEDVEKFVELLEKFLPWFFRSSSEMFTSEGGVKVDESEIKVPMETSTLEYFANDSIWQMENEFYSFVKRLFEQIYERHRLSKLLDDSL